MQKSQNQKKHISQPLLCPGPYAGCWGSNDGLHCELTWPRLSREGVLWNSEEMGRGNFKMCTGNCRFAVEPRPILFQQETSLLTLVPGTQGGFWALQLWFAQTASVQQMAPNDWLQPKGVPQEKSAIQGQRFKEHALIVSLRPFNLLHFNRIYVLK